MLLNRLNRVLYNRSNYCIFSCRKASTENKTILCRLEGRSLLKVKGEEASTFLQGLITNDMRHLETEAKCIFAVFLNTKGRVLYDTIIYKAEEPHSFVIECDQNVIDSLQKHLKLYRVRKKIDIVQISDELNVWALFRSNENTSKEKKPNVQCKELKQFTDPRIASLGTRILTNENLLSTEVLKYFDEPIVNQSEGSYRYHRYKLGVAEGTKDLPPGGCFPLEINCDYLHGVSFHKGCYIGQELTARVHHTGVVRKRIMPLKFETRPNQDIESNTPLLTDAKKSVGHLKCIRDDYALGLVRVLEIPAIPEVTVEGLKVNIIKPHWWPIEAPKEIQIKVKE